MSQNNVIRLLRADGNMRKSGSMGEDRDGQRQGLWMGTIGWLYVCGLALIFLLYGLMMFYLIGDKGPPGWDFGVMQDIPGESVYSTNKAITGGTASPEPQHVFQKPSHVDIPANKEKP